MKTSELSIDEIAHFEDGLNTDFERKSVQVKTEESQFDYYMEMLGEVLAVREFTRPLGMDIALKQFKNKFRM